VILLEKGFVLFAKLFGFLFVGVKDVLNLLFDGGDLVLMSKLDVL
jgi:hypothetical protein